MTSATSHIVPTGLHSRASSPVFGISMSFRLHLSYLTERSILQVVDKGLVAERLLSTMQLKGMLPDFVLCVGDDRSDEDMLELISSAKGGPSLSPVAEIFACTVGQKPSKTKYYLEDTTEIIRMMEGLASVLDKMEKSP